MLILRKCDTSLHNFFQMRKSIFKLGIFSLLLFYSLFIFYLRYGCFLFQMMFCLYHHDYISFSLGLKIFYVVQYVVSYLEKLRLCPFLLWLCGSSNFREELLIKPNKLICVFFFFIWIAFLFLLLTDATLTTFIVISFHVYS